MFSRNVHCMHLNISGIIHVYLTYHEACAHCHNMWEISKCPGMFLFWWLILATSHITGQLHEKYVGCFADNGDNQEVEPALINQSNLTIEICIQKCYNESNETKSETTFAAIANGSRCACRNDSGQQLPDLNCYVQCSGDQMQVCGGNASDRIYSLYTVCLVGYFGSKCDQLCHCKRHLPCDRITGICPNGCDDEWTGISCNISSIQKQYIGCYGDGPVTEQKQAMDVVNPGGTTGEANRYANSVESCIKICSANKNTYAGMQYGYDCHCGETYNIYGNKTYRGQQANCNFNCPANRSQKCGGHFANSVYYVCPLGFYGRNCANRCHCNGYPCRFSGSCLTSAERTCKSRWTGATCNTRMNDILWCSNDTDCELNEACNLIDLNYTNFSRCRCRQGFHRMNIWEHCTDVDECQLNVSTCNLNSENCFNTIGNYSCECKDGFVNISGKCNDIDECGNESLLCETETQICRNTVGRYHCDCKSGYEHTTFGNCKDVDECQLYGSSCNTYSELCIDGIGNYMCTCKKGFTSIFGKCVEFNSTTTAGIILGALLAISLLVNAILIVSRLNSAKSGSPINQSESREIVEQSDFESGSLKILDHSETKYVEIPNRVGQNSMYQEIITGQRQLVLKETSVYTELRQISYVNAVSSP